VVAPPRLRGLGAERRVAERADAKRRGPSTAIALEGAGGAERTLQDAPGPTQREVDDLEVDPVCRTQRPSVG
jgi:hypothetical protein